LIKRLMGGSARERRIRTASAIAFAVGLLFALWFLLLDPLASVQRLAGDAQARKQDGSNVVVIVGIDEESLDRHGRIQDRDRATYAQAIDNLAVAGASVIVVDILFADVSAVDDAGDAVAAEGDLALADSIERSGNVILAAAGQGTPELTAEGAIFNQIVPPTDRFVSAGATVAAANLLSDDDGRVRTLPLAIHDPDGNELPSMSLAATYMQFGRDVPDPIPFEDGELELFGRTVPLEEGDVMRINYVGGLDRFAFLQFEDAFDGNFDPSIVDGKIVLIGLVATAADVHSVPLLGNAHGIEVQANVLDTILRDRFLTLTSDGVTFSVMMLFVVVAALFVPRWRLAFTVAGVIGVIVVYVIIGNLLYNSGRVIDFVNPPVALAIASVSALAYREVAQRAGQRETQDLFGRYVSPQVARELIERADQGDLQLGGELREVTVLFGDIRGFTPLSTQMPPQELVNLLNSHFDVIITRIMENGGIVNKFAGDAVMALWNAPEDQPDHALLACRAAMQAQQDLVSLDAAGPVVRWGFGINTGTVVAGNVGSGRRQEYTVIGDPVNRAARLCGIAPAGEVWIGQPTYELVEGLVNTEPLPPQTIKGIDTPVHPHRLEGPIPAVPVQPVEEKR
jgi:adenylate cyclase